MNTLEPEGGNKSLHPTLDIQILSSSGNPWLGTKISHNGRIHRVDANGKVRVTINGGAVYANETAITNTVREAVGKRVSAIVLKHDMSTGNFKKVD